ncbi:GNAT family N-acetyltransferase [Streptomyces kronopolitis]|uniref:GNAT family N-acetyltransferase n=1 Tax=Streptomyces kronopolitis TaxID=1612435 RepID=UPI003426C3DE
MDITRLDGDSVATIAALLPGFRETMRVELPDDPPVSEALLSRLLQTRHGADRLILTAVDRGDVAGFIKLGMDRSDPKGVGHGSLWVFPGFRRRGAGEALVAAARTELGARGRSMLLADAPHTPAAEKFAAVVGAERRATTLRNRLRLSPDVRADLAAQSACPVPGYRLMRWTDHCPEYLVTSFARAWGAFDGHANGRAMARDPQPADVRARESEAARAGHQLYTVAALSNSQECDGERIVAFCTLYVRDSPMADTGETVVLPEHRRRGLASWLKASVLTGAAAEHQRLTLVQTWNDLRDTAVIGLNARLGFTVDSRWSTYAVPV